jgi:NADPH:quinone reductase-like Zn-dependent oxidoreductase
MAWDLLIDRSDIARTTLEEVPEPEPAEGEAVLRVDRVSVTTNNVTYAVFGDAMSYWSFFPSREGTGRVPLWGFATVVASRSDVPVGTQVYGYLPSSSHLVVTPGPGPAFTDTAPHRAELAAVYNSYLPRVVVDEHEGDLQLLYRPLFGTAFLLADLLASVDGAEQVVLSSASSKTAYGTAHLLRDRRVVGLTSEANAGFVRSLGCYDDVLPYAEASRLAEVPTAYADLSGSATLRTAVHERLGDALLHSAVVGATHADEGGPTGPLPGPRPEFFFAPDRIELRSREWGRDGFRSRFDEAWASFVPVVDGWVDVQVGSGAEALRSVWSGLVAGDVDPRAGHVVDLG